MGLMQVRSSLLLGLALAVSACASGSIERADAYEAQFDRLMALRAYPAALASINKAIAHDDTNPRRYTKRAELQLSIGRPSDAVGSFQQALDLQPDNIEALQNLAILAARSGKEDIARRYIDPLMALSPNDPAALLASGTLALAQNHPADTLKFSDRFIALLPNNAEGYAMKARALDGLGRTAEAIGLLEKRAATVSDSRGLLLPLMSLYRRDGNLEGIRNTAIRLMPLYPDDPRYALESARAYAARGRPDRARAITGDLVRRYAGNADVLIAVADLWREVGSAEQGRAELLDIAARSSPRIRAVLADKLTDMGDPQAAAQMLAPLAPADVTSDNVDAQARYARALFAAGRSGPARAKVDAVLAFDRSNAVALLISARLKFQARDYRGAVTDAQLVSSDDDQNAEAALLIPRIYAAQGNQILAAGAFGSARRNFPDSAVISRAEIDWLLAQGRNEEAAQRAAAFFHTHPRSGPASQTYRYVCVHTRAETCRFDAASMS